MEYVLMEYPWNTHGILIEYTRNTHGIRMAYSWLMVYTWNIHGIFMEYSWKTLERMDWYIMVGSRKPWPGARTGWLPGPGLPGGVVRSSTPFKVNTNCELLRFALVTAICYLWLPIIMARFT